jgi:hypothetical protein
VRLDRDLDERRVAKFSPLVACEQDATLDAKNAKRPLRNELDVRVTEHVDVVQNCQFVLPALSHGD